MFWGDSIVEDFLAQYREEAKKRPLIIRDEKTLSGRPHVGSLRSFVMHATLSDVLTDHKIDHHYYYEINDTDAFDSVPKYVPAELKEHLGKPLKDVPSPDGKAKNYAMFFADEYKHALVDSKYNVEFYINSDRYAAGEYDQYIRLALDHKDDIRRIYKEVSGSDKPESWYPCQVICDACGKIATTKITDWDGEEVSYNCNADVKYTKGCGHSGKKSPFGGNATMPWKVEWAAKFCVVGVDLEGAGKDHYAAGGSRHVSNRICEEVFKHKHPFDVRHEFILVGGAKMSSSSGVGATAVAVYEMLPRYLFRFMMIQKDVMKTINFTPDGDTIPVLFDQYDQICSAYFEDRENLQEHKRRFFEFTHFYEEDLNTLERFLPRFSHVSFFVQMPHIDIYEKFAEIKGSALTDADRAELDLRIKYAKKWLEKWSPEKYVFKVQEEIPEQACYLTRKQKDFLGFLSKFLSENKEAKGHDIQTFIHEQKTALDMKPAEIFKAIYVSILDKTSGPQAGWLLEALENEFIIRRFKDVAESEDKEKEEEKINIPDGRLENKYFMLTEQAAMQFPEVQIAYAVIEGVTVNDGGEALAEYRKENVLSAEQAEAKDCPVFEQYKAIYKRMGVDPTKKKPTSIALVNRLAKGKDLYQINNVVDVCNLMTLKDGISFGAFNFDKIKFPVHFSLTKGTEEFWGLMEKKAKRVGKGELCMIDANGTLLNRDYNYRDSEITKISPETTKVFLTFDSLDPMSVEDAKAKLEEAANTLVKFCGGKITEIFVS
jgi:lysyl-tRNA synthetase class 1